jgi:hypothetical protein
MVVVVGRVLLLWKAEGEACRGRLIGLVVYGRRKGVGAHCIVWYYNGGVALMTVRSVVIIGLRLESRRWHF